MAEIGGIDLNSTITVGELVKRLGARDRNRILKAFAKPDIQIAREEWAGASRLLAGNAGRGDHAKFAKVVMLYLGTNDEERAKVDAFISNHGATTKNGRRGRPRKED